MGKPGSKGEHALQQRYGTEKRANAFYDKQVLDYLNPRMTEFVRQQEIVFVATADGDGECDCSLRAGEAGFVYVLDEKRLIYPEYRGNGVVASLGNIAENPHIGMMFIDFVKDTVGLHINGKAEILENDAVLKMAEVPAGIAEAIGQKGKRRPERWVLVQVEEAYMHCSKHIPLYQKREKPIRWGTDDPKKKKVDYFVGG